MPAHSCHEAYASSPHSPRPKSEAHVYGSSLHTPHASSESPPAAGWLM